jgi:uncharacterized protein
MAMASPPIHTNRLANETSPYLLQHQHNPVDWYPWGEEAFTRARAENKPIFLSVGYSTCYWCHVMERQSFENEATAAEMNARFVNIKVDREERPDVDQLYMTAVQVLTRQGGWPMSVFLTPDLRPFYGGTYFPPNDSHGRPGFVTVLRAIDDAYHNRHADVEQSAQQLVNILTQLAEPRRPESAMKIDGAFVDSLIERSISDYDAQNGGFGHAPKFPRETLLELLLVHQRHHPNESRMKMIRHTLDSLARGGIRDHLGGGFHRYSTDAYWLVPHFEIMLYDNAMLAWVYTEAFRQTHEKRYRSVASKILDFILRDMRSKDGAFYTAFDAEVDGREGQNYLWTAGEVEAVLGAEDAKFFNRWYGLDRGPNFADPHHSNGVPDRNVLYLANGFPEARDEGLKLREMRSRLLEERRKRKQPGLDSKIITSWNALMIRAMAFAGKVFEQPQYTQAAAVAASFLLDNHLLKDGTLIRTSRDGKSGPAGFLDDYAFLAQACLALEDAGDTARNWRDHATSLMQTAKDRFGDAAHGGFYFSDASAKDLIIRQKTANDSPLPSGNAVAALVLLDLGQSDVARGVLDSFAEQLDQSAESMSSMVQAAVEHIRKFGPLEIAPGRTSPADRPLSPAELANSVVTLGAAMVSPTELHLHLTILNDFHINSHAAARGMIATNVTASGIDVDAIDYPPGAERELAFADEAMRVYEGQVIIVLHLKHPPKGSFRLAVSYQACDESACLPPVTKAAEIAFT